MLNRLSQSMYRHYSLPLLLAWFLPTVGFFLLFNFSHFSIPMSNPQLIGLSGGEGLLDLKLFYTAQEAYASMTQYGEAGRALYKNFLAADFIFALCYGGAFSVLLTRLLGALEPAEWRWKIFNLLPMAIALVDYLEDIFIYAMLNAYPQPVQTVATLAGVSTLTKHLLTLVSMLFLLNVVLVLLRRKIKARKICVR